MYSSTSGGSPPARDPQGCAGRARALACHPALADGPASERRLQRELELARAGAAPSRVGREQLFQQLAAPQHEQPILQRRRVRAVQHQHLCPLLHRRAPQRRRLARRQAHLRAARRSAQRLQRQEHERPAKCCVRCALCAGRGANQALELVDALDDGGKLPGPV